MGNFYANITLRGPLREDVVAVLETLRRKAFVSPTVGAATVVYDRVCDELDEGILADLAGRLSHQLCCPALAVLVHDDDFLLCLAFDRGRFLTRYTWASSRAHPDLGPGASDEEFAERVCSAFDALGELGRLRSLLAVAIPSDAEDYQLRSLKLIKLLFQAGRGKGAAVEKIRSMLNRTADLATAQRHMAILFPEHEDTADVEHPPYDIIMAAIGFHEALAGLLGLGTYAVGTSYRDLLQGDVPEGELSDFIRVGV